MTLAPEQRSTWTETFSIAVSQNDAKFWETLTWTEPLRTSTTSIGISNGWPRVLSGLKTFLETGHALADWATCKAAPQAKVA